MRSLALLSLLFLTVPTEAAEFCQDQDLVVDTQTSWDFSNGFFHAYTLPTHRQGQVYPTKSVLQLGAGITPSELLGNGAGPEERRQPIVPEAPEELFGIFEFPREPNEVGLAYNLYRLQIQIGGDDEPDRLVIDQDYTGGCSGPGISLWPGDRVELKPIKITPHADGSPRGLEAVHLLFWGK